MAKKYSNEYICQLLEYAIVLSQTVCGEYCSGGCKCTNYEQTVEDCIKGLTNGTK